jgi:phenylpropionate dioxygenase-like ring-hydroxylating dioxygenase large terminal subunit
MNQRLNEPIGRAYGRKPGEPDPILPYVGPGTPGGELLRRYWQPIALSSEATHLPKQIRRLGEDLILFRNKNGEAGLLTPRCLHRGTSLLYGRVEEDGIRCCYHGWKFGCQGQVLDQPCEEGGGLRKHKLRQPWYPVVEEFGSIWAYMGPPDRQPLFPIFSCFENVREDEEIISEYLDSHELAAPFPQDFNWFQTYENAADHYHIPILHARMAPQFSDPRFGPELPEIEWRYSDAGDSILTTSRRDLGNGEVYVRIEQGLVPSMIALPPFFWDGPGHDIWFFVPFDDTTFSQIRISRQPKSFVFDPNEIIGEEMKRWRDMTLEEHQLYPMDYEAQGSQGKITLHSDENLAGSDAGVVKHRLLWKRQAKIVAEGGDPIGVAFKEEDRRIVIEAASWMEKVKEPAPEPA